MKDTDLSKYIWSMKDQTNTKWDIVKKINSRVKLKYHKLYLFKKFLGAKNIDQEIRIYE